MKYIACFIFVLMLSLSASAQEEIYDNPKPKPSIFHPSDEELLNDDTPETTEKTTKNKKYISEDDSVFRKFDPKKLRIGGSFGLQFGNYTYINLSPTLGYLFWKDRLELGAGPIFIYQSVRYSNSYRQSYLFYGADIYARGYIWKGLFLQAQYDLINKEAYYQNGRINVSHLLLGGGYSTPIGDIGSFYASMMYNVLNNKESVYQGTFGKFPLIMNIGFGFGIRGKNR